MTSNVEFRSFVEPVEFRSADGGKIVAAGTAMRYGARSKVIPQGNFREIVKPGSFARAIGANADVSAHYEHFGPYLGRTGAGTLRLIDSRSELGYEIDLRDTTAGRDVARLLEDGDIKGSSVGFARPSVKATWSVDDDGIALRSISEARLVFVDLTVSPAYDDSTADLALRSLAEDRGIEVRSVLEAAARGELSQLISSDPDDVEHRSEPVVDDIVVPPRARILSLYL